MRRGQRAPIAGPKPPAVAERPICANCGQPLKPEIFNHWEKRETELGHTTEITHRYWTGDYVRYGYFCTMRCGVQWANDWYPEVRKTQRHFKL